MGGGYQDSLPVSEHPYPGSLEILIVTGLYTAIHACSLNCIEFLCQIISLLLNNFKAAKPDH